MEAVAYNVVKIAAVKILTLIFDREGSLKNSKLEQDLKPWFVLYCAAHFSTIWTELLTQLTMIWSCVVIYLFIIIIIIFFSCLCNPCKFLSVFIYL